MLSQFDVHGSSIRSLVMISHRIVLCSLAALLSLAVISYAQGNYVGKLCMSNHTTGPDLVI